MIHFSLNLIDFLSFGSNWCLYDMKCLLNCAEWTYFMRPEWIDCV